MRLKQKIQEKISEIESENDRILQGINEDQQLPDSQAQAILRSSYFNNGSIQGLKEVLGLLDEAMQELDKRAFLFHGNMARLVKFEDVKAVLGVDGKEKATPT